MNEFVVTEIKIQNYCYDIYINNEFFGTFRKKSFKALNVHEEMSLDNIDELRKSLYIEEYERGKYISMKLLGFSSKSKYEIVEKLKSKNISEKSIFKVIDFLEEYKFLDDDYYAERLVNQHYNSGKSKKYIQAILSKKGIDKELCNEVLENLSEDMEFQNAIKFGEKKLKAIKSDDEFEIKYKLKTFLSYKGFSYSVIERVINKILFDNSN